MSWTFNDALWKHRAREFYRMHNDVFPALISPIFMLARMTAYFSFAYFGFWGDARSGSPFFFDQRKGPSNHQRWPLTTYAHTYPKPPHIIRQGFKRNTYPTTLVMMKRAARKTGPRYPSYENFPIQSSHHHNPSPSSSPQDLFLPRVPNNPSMLPPLVMNFCAKPESPRFRLKEGS